MGKRDHQGASRVWNRLLRFSNNERKSGCGNVRQNSTLSHGKRTCNHNFRRRETSDAETEKREEAPPFAPGGGALHPSSLSCCEEVSFSATGVSYVVPIYKCPK